MAFAAVAPQDLYPGETPQMRALIREYAAFHDIPEALLHRVIQRESDYRAEARNGPYYGLMQVLPETARGLGYDGPASGLLDAETNLRWAGAYLRGAWLVSDGDISTRPWAGMPAAIITRRARPLPAGGNRPARAGSAARLRLTRPHPLKGER